MPAIDRADVIHSGTHTFQKGTVVKTTGGNVHDTTPTAAQLAIEATAALATYQATLSIVNDNAGGTNVYISVEINGEYFWVKMTKAL